MKKSILFFATFLIFAFSNNTAKAHCEVPCGIYDDQLRVELIKEHIRTIEKAMNQITEIQSSDNVNYNQLVRWISTKEDHANKIQNIVQQYFLTQRVKFAAPNDREKYNTYITQLTSLHEVLVYAMKAKQSTDLKYIAELNKSIEVFEKSYFGDKKHDHKH